MGLGIPEAMLVSAAVGGASAAATGKDPLMGAVLGGAGSLVGPALGAAAGEALGTVAGEALNTVTPAITDAAAGSNLGSFGSMTTGLDGATATNALSTVAPEEGLKALTQAGIRPDFYPAGAPEVGIPSLDVSPVTTPTTAYQQGIQSGIGATPPQQLGTSFAKDPFKFAMENKAPLISAAIAGQAAGSAYQPGIMSGPEDDPNNPLRRYRFDPNRYRPILRGYADGGIASVAPPGYDMMVGEPRMYADGGGISDLGTYSDGGRMLKGRGDGMSDSIPGVIGGKRPARLADGEFVVPADVVSHLGNGSTDAGAKQLYKMMDKVRAARTGTRKQGRQINPRRFMPA